MSEDSGKVIDMPLRDNLEHVFSPAFGLDFCESCSKTWDEGNHADEHPGFSEHERAGEIMGFRPTNVVPLDMPVEIGFWCPVCRVPSPNEEGEYDERLQWSEYQGFLWCSVCNYDYPSALCIDLAAEKDPLRADRYAGRDDAVSVFLSQVGAAIERAQSNPDDNRDGK